MNNKLKELMELSNAVDVIIKQADEGNAAKEEKLKYKMLDRWNAMWDDMDDILPAVEMLRPQKHYKHIGKYNYGYPYGWDALRTYGITFVVVANTRTKIMMDCVGGWGEITRDSFDELMRCHRPCIEMLLEKWDGVYENMTKDIEMRIADNIKKKIKDCKERTEEIDRKLEIY